MTLAWVCRLLSTCGEIPASHALWAPGGVSCATKAAVKEDPPVIPSASITSAIWKTWRLGDIFASRTFQDHE